MKTRYALLLLLAGLFIGSLAQRTTAQVQAELTNFNHVKMRVNSTALDLADVMFEANSPPVTVTTLKDIFDKVDGRARTGDLSAALVMYRLHQLQAAKKAK